MPDVRLIDANALMKNIGKIPQLRGITYGRMKKAVEETPTIDAVPVVHGRWSEPFIGGYDGLHAVYYMTCSKCMGEVRHSIFRYCPNCGARMDGGAE